MDLADALVRRHPLGGPDRELAGIARAAGDHEGDRCLARARVRPPDERGVGDGRVGGERGLELSRPAPAKA
jgi:hypothetical protein